MQRGIVGAQKTEAGCLKKHSCFRQGLSVAQSGALLPERTSPSDSEGWLRPGAPAPGLAQPFLSTLVNMTGVPTTLGFAPVWELQRPHRCP